MLTFESLHVPFDPCKISQLASYVSQPDAYSWKKNRSESPSTIAKKKSLTYFVCPIEKRTHRTKTRPKKGIRKEIQHFGNSN